MSEGKGKGVGTEATEGNKAGVSEDDEDDGVEVSKNVQNGDCNNIHFHNQQVEGGGLEEEGVAGINFYLFM